ncbi:hypothetical protein D3C72_2512900 [compost metagenome]
MRNIGNLLANLPLFPFVQDAFRLSGSKQAVHFLQQLLQMPVRVTETNLTIGLKIGPNLAKLLDRMLQ